MTGRSVVCRLLALLGVSCGLAGPALAQTDTGQSSEMIVNGFPVEEGQIPWQVFLTRTWTDPDGKSWASWCGGSLIAPQWVLTAAHCLEDEGVAHKPQEMEVGYGSVHRSKLKTVKVEQVIPHAEYESKGSDIGLMKLKRPIGIIKPIPLAEPRFDAALHSGQSNEAPTYLVSGWGRLLDIGDINLATQLHQVNPQQAQAMAEEITLPSSCARPTWSRSTSRVAPISIRASAMRARPAPSTSSAISAPRARAGGPIHAKATAAVRSSPRCKTSSCKSAW